jgi:hypothetical protein
MIAALKNNNKAKASVVDGKLILSFPHAQTPVLWQMDLTNAKASALEVLKKDKGNEFTLTLKNPKGETIEIAVFASREQALEGLLAASSALEKAQGQIQIAANDGQSIAVATPTAKPSKGRWLTGVLGVIALIVFIGIWSLTAPVNPNGYATTGTNPATAIQQQAAAPASQSSGVPVSADAFLSGR